MIRTLLRTLEAGVHRLAMFVLLVVSLTGCDVRPTDSTAEGWSANVAAFEGELRELQSVLGIPGLAFVIIEEGEPVASRAHGIVEPSRSAPFTVATPRRVASVTKSFTAVAAMQLVEEGRLELDTLVHPYVEADVPEDVQVRHLLTHTSEGIVGEEFVYGTTRYGRLADVIEAVTGDSFEEVLRQRIIEPAGMRWHPSPLLGAHAGLESTVDDMAAYLMALDDEVLLDGASRDRLALPSLSSQGRTLPVSLGWFVQTIQDEPVMWSFGQDDPDHSGALLLRVPARKLSLFVLASSNALSDPFRLLMGDVSKSPFAMSFLRLFVFSEPGVPLSRPGLRTADLGRALARLERDTSYRYRDELIGWALVDLWREQPESASVKLQLALDRYGVDTPDPILQFASVRHPPGRVKENGRSMGATLLQRHPHNRWILLAQGHLLQQLGENGRASDCFRRILALPNQENDLAHRLFNAWSWLALAEMIREDDPTRARQYLDNIIHSDVEGETLEDAQRILRTIEGGPES